MTTNSTGYYSSYGSGYGAYGSQQQSGTASPQAATTTPSAQNSPIDLVAVDEHARIWGDPHIDDADGGKYDFQERGIYNLLTDKNINLNAKTDGPEGGPTYVTEAGLVVDGEQVNVASDGTVTIGVGTDAYELQDGETRQLSDGSYITKEGDKVTVGTPEYKIEFSTNKEHEGTQYMDIDIYTRDRGVAMDGQTPTGLVGETFDADDKAQTGTKKDAEAYQRSGLYDSGETAPPQLPPAFPTPFPPPTTFQPPPFCPPELPPGMELPPPGTPVPAPSPVPAPAPAPPPGTPVPAPSPVPAPAPAPAPPADSQMQQLMMMFVQMIQLLMQMIMGGSAGGTTTGQGTTGGNTLG